MVYLKKHIRKLLILTEKNKLMVQEWKLPSKIWLNNYLLKDSKDGIVFE